MLLISKRIWAILASAGLTWWTLAGPALAATAAPDPLPALAKGVLTGIIDERASLTRDSLGAVAGVPSAVGIQTRVVSGDGSEASDYSVIVGTNTYVAPPLDGGGSAGFHLVVLSRQTLALVTNTSYAANPGALSALQTELQNGLDETMLLVLDSMGPPGNLLPIPPLEAVIAAFGGTPAALYDVSQIQYAAVYSLIGNQGLKSGHGFERSNLVNPQTSGSINAVLRPDLAGNYFPVASSFVTLQTSAGASQDTLMIGTNAFPAPLPLGAQSGFHLAILRADILDQAAGNPAVVLLNQSYATGIANPAQSVTELGRLQEDLASYQTQIASGQTVVLLASVGPQPIYCTTSVCGFDEFPVAIYLEALQAFIRTNLGGVGDLMNAGAGTYYSMVGIPWPGGTHRPQTVENRSWTRASGMNGSVNLAVLMHPNPQGWYVPLASDTVGGVDYRLFEIASQPPVPWPVAPNSSAAPCAAGDQECAAYQWISLQLTGNNLSIRDEYIVTTADFAGYTNLLGRLAYDSSSSNSFSEVTFDAVKSQLLVELGDVPYVQSLYEKYVGVVNAMTQEQTSMLLATLGNVISDIQAPAAANVTLNAEGILRFMIQVGAAVTTIDPEVKAALGVVNALFYLGYSKNKDAAGNGDNVIADEVSNLAGDIGTSFVNNREGVAATFQEILTDWEKLNTVASLVNSTPGPGNGFAWEIGTTGSLLAAMEPAFELGFYQALLPTRFQQVVFVNVPFSNPNAYTYQDDCSISPYGAYCKCHSDVYVPPPFDYLAVELTGPVGQYNIYVIATADLQYPVGNLMTNTLPSLGVYPSDLFQGLGTWTGVLPTVAPQGWQDYLNPVGGYCDGDLATEPQSGNPLRLHSRGQAGLRYQLEWTSALGGLWQTAGEPVLADQGLMTLIPDLPNSSAAFFRLRRLE